MGGGHSVPSSSACSLSCWDVSASAAETAAAAAAATADDDEDEDKERIVEALHRRYLRHLVKSVEYWSGSWMMGTLRDE